ncbi:MAG: D-isomer specific 2-hydroxyacid dehydrogenase, NAD-binding protein [Candidatus Berkelbacteria bacterium Licking1014_85]|uniref:D-isomer specific 2-hydroxyacid dehydrogenase, NAD-binding protein n=1 Tax=Candidatus Berkelbacteria bacterium Licking1014_85 TaxID=2017148 RepID=A0A554LMS3_9BACT|nr:MAG: D-isomer specific 2-hydroxyacid dehydrogenase, NAD-binding protein [Candidatus Berkelbacteria bacterium Licking1014_85]
MKILLTYRISQLGIDYLKNHGFDIDINPHDRPLSKNELIKKMHGKDGVISMLFDKIDKSVMDCAGKNLKVIANYAVGYDNIDVEEAKKRNIIVTNTPSVLTESVAEHTIALMLAVSKRIVEADKFTRAGKYKHWMPLGFLGTQLWGKTLGIVGLGRIGSFLAEIAYYGFKMKIMYYDISRDDRFEMELRAKYGELNTVLKNSDFISLNCPLNDSTRHLIGKNELKIMKPTAILVNTSRGPVIDESALVEALKSKKIAGAGLDVFEFEPKLAKGLAKLDNVILTPHIASATLEAREAMSLIVAKNIFSVLTLGKGLNEVK